MSKQVNLLRKRIDGTFSNMSTLGSPTSVSGSRYWLDCAIREPLACLELVEPGAKWLSSADGPQFSGESWRQAHKKTKITKQMHFSQSKTQTKLTSWVKVERRNQRKEPKLMQQKWRNQQQKPRKNSQRAWWDTGRRLPLRPRNAGIMVSIESPPFPNMHLKFTRKKIGKKTYF